MGRTINRHVKVKISDDVQRYANIKIDSKVDSFVFCVSRSIKDELCMAYAIVAASEEEAEKLLHSNPHLKNVLDDFKVCKRLEAGTFEAFQEEAVGRGEIPPPVMRACCPANRNVPIYIVEKHEDGARHTTVLFNKFIQATFAETDLHNNPITDPFKKPLTTITIREVANPNQPQPDTKCQSPAS